MKKCKKVKMNASKNSFEELAMTTLNIMGGGEKLAEQSPTPSDN